MLNSVKTNDTLFLATKQAAQLSEQIKLIRTKIELAQARNHFSLLMVTSPIKGDGKTTIATNLAVEFTKIGKKVILLAADLNEISDYRGFALKNVDFGLSDYLKDTNKKISSDQIIYQASAYALLSVVPNFKAVPDATDLMDNSKMGQLLSQLKSDFDLVILDAPAMGPNSDGFVLANLVDQTILVIRLGKSKKDLSEKAIQLLKQAKTGLLGIVNNDVH